MAHNPKSQGLTPHRIYPETILTRKGDIQDRFLPGRPNYPKIYPKYPLLGAIRTLLKGPFFFWGGGGPGLPRGFLEIESNPKFPKRLLFRYVGLGQ